MWRALTATTAVLVLAACGGGSSKANGGAAESTTVASSGPRPVDLAVSLGCADSLIRNPLGPDDPLAMPTRTKMCAKDDTIIATYADTGSADGRQQTLASNPCPLRSSAGARYEDASHHMYLVRVPEGLVLPMPQNAGEVARKLSGSTITLDTQRCASTNPT